MPNLSLRERCPYSEFFSSVFSHSSLRMSSIAGKCRPQKLRIQTLFTHSMSLKAYVIRGSLKNIREVTIKQVKRRIMDNKVNRGLL